MGIWHHSRSRLVDSFLDVRCSYRPQLYAYSPYWYGSPGHTVGPYWWPDSYPAHYFYSPYWPYLYFYDLYYRESLRSKQEADEYEASLACEKRHQPVGPLEASSDPQDANPTPRGPDDAPISPRDVVLTLDGRLQAPSPSGSPLVIGSGHHTLRISRKPPLHTARIQAPVQPE